jgi:hypothetical protein
LSFASKEIEKLKNFLILGIDILMLLFYGTKAHYWQFAVIRKNKKSWQLTKIFTRLLRLKN